MELRKLKRFSVLVALLFLFSNLLHAQTKTVTGRITDATGVGLPGVTVTVKGTQIAAATDAEGRYTINVPTVGSSIVISSVGYGQQELKVGSLSQINVTLQAAAASLNEVVVVGYGVQRKRDVTGAISKVSGDQISATPVPSFEAALQGKAPGVQIIQGNGLAGSGAVVRIRGIGSISASGDPLYVVDGIPVIADPFQRGNGGGMNQNPLASINPADIESVEVLKDAGATGIYGSRGANGVILITTKRGKNGKASYSYSNKLGIATYSQKPEFVNGQEWLQLRQEAWMNSGHTGQAPLPNEKLSRQQATQTNTDWWDEITRQGFINEHNLSFNKGSKRLKTFANVSYSDNESYIKNNAYARLSARLNMDYNLMQNIKISLTSGYNRGVNKRVPAAWDGGIGDAMSSALPIYPIYKDDKTYYTDATNPIRRLNETKRREIDSRLIGGISIEYQPITNLYLKAQGSIERINSYDDQFESYLWQNKSVPDSGFASRTPYFGKNWTTTYTANYLWNPNDENKFNFLVGAEAQEYDLKEYRVGFGEWASAGYWENPSHYQDTLNNTPDSLRRARDQWTFNSFFGRLHYTLKNRYSLQLTARVDGSSKFGTNNKHGFFPAASASWVISDEKFMKGIREINFLKLRASYGIVGNANFPNGRYFDEWMVGGVRYNGNPTLYLNAPGNPDLKWETMHNVDAGLEFGLFSSRLTGEIAYYHKTTTDILLSPGVQRSSGNESGWRNLENSKILNEGIEISANVKIINKPELKWSVGGNIARNYNEVLEYELGPDAVSGGTNDTRIVKGLPVGVNYVVRYHDVDPADGLPIWLDKNGKQTKTFSLDHRVYAGAVIPDYVGGFNTLLNYKNFDVSALFSFVIGGNIYENSGKYQFLGVSKKNWNFRKDFLDRWTEPGDESKYPKLLYDATDYPGVPSEDQFNSTMFLRDASYMRLRELSVSYRFAKGAFGASSFVKDLRLFVTGTNLLTFTKFPGGDPEITRDFENAQDRNLSPNITYLTAPSQRTVVFGLNLNF